MQFFLFHFIILLAELYSKYFQVTRVNSSLCFFVLEEMKKTHWTVTCYLKVAAGLVVSMLKSKSFLQFKNGLDYLSKILNPLCSVLACCFNHLIYLVSKTTSVAGKLNYEWIILSYPPANKDLGVSVHLFVFLSIILVSTVIP